MSHAHPYARDWIVLARTMRVEAFVALYPGPFLLGCEVADSHYVFETRARALGREERRALAFEDAGAEGQGPKPQASDEQIWASADALPEPIKGQGRRWVIPVRKNTGAPAQHRIFVGRDVGNDICIPHPTVSKLQGYFSRPQSGEPRWTFFDADSANGTRLNHQPISSRRTISIRDGDRLGFGECEFFWLSPEKLHTRLLDMDRLRERGP